MLKSSFAVNGQRYDPKPHEDYLGYFVHVNQDLKYSGDTDVWTLAQDTTRQVKACGRRR